MPLSKAFLLVLRLVGVGIGGAAVIGQLVTSLNYWSSAGVTDFVSPVTNFFSFFTILSNIAAIVTLCVSAVYAGLRRAEPGWLTVTRVSVVSYMAVTGIVYNLLLRGIELPQGATLGWSNEVLHVVLPLIVVTDWLLAPGTVRLRWRAVGWVVAFPIVWAIYTMIRGPLAYDVVRHRETWYPYPFLDPAASPQGYATVAFYIILIALIIAGTGAAAILWNRHRTPPAPDSRGAFTPLNTDAA